MEVWVVQAKPWPLYAWEGDPVPIVQEAVRALGLINTGVRNLAPSGLEPRTVQNVASRYADCSIPAHKMVSYCD